MDNIIFIDSWWDHDDDDPRGRDKRPTRCSCCRKLIYRHIDPETEEYHCREHGLAVVAKWETKRTGKAAWCYYRLPFKPTAVAPEQLRLFHGGQTGCMS